MASTKRRKTATRPKAANGDGSMYWDSERGVHRCVVVLPDGKRLTRRTKGPTVAEATALLADLKAEAKAFGPRPLAGTRGSWTVGSWLTYWRANAIGKRKGRHGKGVSKSTLRREDWASDAITKAVGDIPLRQLVPEDVESFLSLRAMGVDVDRKAWSEDACYQVKNFLARSLDEAIERGHRSAPNPARRANVPTHAADPNRRSTLSPEVASRLYDAARSAGKASASVLALMVTTGLRPGEAIRVKWGHVDLDARSLHVPDAKTDNGIRTVHLSDPALAVMRDRRQAVGLVSRDPGAYVFPGDFAPHVCHYAIVDELARLCEAENIRVVDFARAPRPHELRHTVASILLDADMSPQAVADMLGDDVATILRTYRHQLRAVAGEAAAAPMAQVFGKAS